KAQRAGDEPVSPVYTIADAIGAISRFRPCEYGQIIRAEEGVVVRFSDIGHLLGSACIELWLTEDGVTKKVVFSGDVGNTDQPLIKDPLPVEETDYLVLEATYGDRHHEKPGDTVGELAEILQYTFDRGGNVVIPSFAVGRTQEMLYAIRQIKQEGMVRGHDGFPVYVDSPLAIEATAIFMQCDQSCFDEETAALVKQGINPIWFDDICLSVTSEESKQINFDRRPKVILSASGMCEAGRIRHHLKHNLWGKENTILFVGYQAEGSLGRKLQDGAQYVRLFGEDISVNAQIAALHGTSGHADQAGLLRWLSGFREKPQTVFVNHGDDASCVVFQKLLAQMGYNAEAPYSGTEYDLLTGRMTVYTDAKLIRRAAALKGSARAQAVYRDLLAAAEALLAFAKTCKGRTNKDNAKLAAQIRSLIEKWK
ncbi:MAG: MBL fold metallo-hydrolase, partial [Oscillospiraceae bacterium]|nr:MBL fold metallo-hydrolase [Oscillospiraceae bacterium]